MEAARGQKHPCEAKKKHEGVDLLKKVFNKSCLATSKTPNHFRRQHFLGGEGSKIGQIC
jgi:hypothetical protein